MSDDKHSGAYHRIAEEFNKANYLAEISEHDVEVIVTGKARSIYSAHTINSILRLAAEYGIVEVPEHDPDKLLEMKEDAESEQESIAKEKEAKALLGKIMPNKSQHQEHEHWIELCKELKERFDIDPNDKDSDVLIGRIRTWGEWLVTLRNHQPSEVRSQAFVQAQDFLHQARTRRHKAGWTERG